MNGAKGLSNGIDRNRHAKEQRQYFTEINDELADKGFLVTSTDDLINWARTGSLMWMTLRPGLLRRRNDAHLDAALRPRAIRRCTSRFAAPV